MKWRICGLCSLALFFAMPEMLGAAQTTSGTAISRQIEETIAKVRSGKNVDARTNAAEHLESLTKKIDAEEVTDGFVTELISLLDSPDDSVRYWVAWSLGDLGPAAKAAVPKLEQMLPEADCLDGAITSASGIRYALFRMGVKEPPRPPDCHPIAG